MERGKMGDLEKTARSIRRSIVSMIGEAGSGHPGGSLSCVEILCALYLGGIMNHSPQDPKCESRDRFVMSKGHAAPALYATLSEAGYLPEEELATLRKWGSRLQGHPDMRKLSCLEASTGSLGQGLSIASGLACGLRINGSDSFVFALLGDGECEEGQVWEAAMFAANQRLGNLCAIVDNNGLQIDGHIEDVAGLGNIERIFESFGWDAVVVDGHDIDALIRTLSSIKERSGDVPTAVIAKTVKGKGVSFMEGEAGWHGKAPNQEQLEAALAELAGESEEL